MLMLGSREVTMARLIPFYVPQNFKAPKKHGQPLEQRGKIIEFQSASIKEVCLGTGENDVLGVFTQSVGSLMQGLDFKEEQVYGR